ncbi:MAG: methyltransferase family protein [Rhodoferax sp.]
MSRLENRVPPPALAIVVGLLMFLTSNFLPQREPNSLAQWIGIAALLALAGNFGIRAIRLFNRSETTIDPVRIHRASSLVTSGIYQVSRNPMYVGLTMALCAWCTWLWSPALVCGPVAFVAFIHRFQILPEERVMLEKFGGEYLEYKAKVRRWL